MTVSFRLIPDLLAGSFKSPTELQAEILVLRHQLNGQSQGDWAGPLFSSGEPKSTDFGERQLPSSLGSCCWH